MRLAIILTLLVSLLAVACGDDDDSRPNQLDSSGGTPASGEPTATALPLTVDLQITDITVGDGDAAASGNTISVHYVGTLEDGTQFDSSRDRNEPFVFTLGAGQVISGWDQGVAGMQVGGVRRLVIPPELAYGEAGRPPVIPPSATLVFEIELLDVQ